jgi:hypothetical protein
MKLKSRDLAFAAIVLFVLGGLWFLSTKNKAKAMTPRPEHLNVKSRDDCLKCHLPSKLAEMELQHKHPGKWSDARVECTRCHNPPQETKVQTLNARLIEEWARLPRRAN